MSPTFKALRRLICPHDVDVKACSEKDLHGGLPFLICFYGCQFKGRCIRNALSVTCWTFGFCSNCFISSSLNIFELALVLPISIPRSVLIILIKTQMTRKKVTFFKVSILRVTVQCRPGFPLFGYFFAAVTATLPLRFRYCSATSSRLRNALEPMPGTPLRWTRRACLRTGPGGLGCWMARRFSACCFFLT